MHSGHIMFQHGSAYSGRTLVSVHEMSRFNVTNVWILQLKVIWQAPEGFIDGIKPQTKHDLDIICPESVEVKIVSTI